MLTYAVPGHSYPFVPEARPRARCKMMKVALRKLAPRRVFTMTAAKRYMFASLLVHLATLCGGPSYSAAAPTATVRFLHGVASGDPLPDAVILWTRATPLDAAALHLDVVWEVSRELLGGTDEKITRSGVFRTNADRDWTVNLDVRRLTPGLRYHYRFQSGGAVSDVGTFKLPPKQGDHLAELRYAVFSCTNWRFGYFNAYEAAADLALDFWLHLGDFYYEYGNDQYPEPAQAVREGLDPPHEAITLDDYRRRHAHYRLESPLQALSASAALIAVWDDHEMANDAYSSGAQNHGGEGEGSWNARQLAAATAYREWMPVRGLHTDAPFDLYRSFEFGDLATLVMMEARSGARTSQNSALGHPGNVSLSDVPNVDGWVTEQIGELIEKFPLPPSAWSGSELEEELIKLRVKVDAFRNSPERQIVGTTQLEWAGKVTAASSRNRTKWQLFGQPQVMQDHNSGNWDDAIVAATEQGDNPTAARWAVALANVTRWPWQLGDANRSYVSYSPDYSKADVLGTELALTRVVARKVIVNIAAGRYKLTRAFDDWHSHLAERSRLLSAIGTATNAIVYGGDLHSAWAGELRVDGKTVAAEFDVMAVTSANEGLTHGYLPMDLLDAGTVAANRDSGLKYANVHAKGFALVSLTHDRQHVRYLSVPVDQPGLSHAAECLKEFEVVPDESHRVQVLNC